jgi:RNA polymerase sigma-70 factor (ECF subfamily)
MIDPASQRDSEIPPTEREHPVTDWLHRVARKDRQAFIELYLATAPKLLGTVLRIVKDKGRADDVLQETFVKIWQRADQFDEHKSSPITWMVSIARNGAIDDLRRHPAGREGTEDDLEQLASPHPGAIDHLAERESVNALGRCIDELEKDRADMVRLAYLNGWTREALAEHFDQPLNTVKTWLHRALKQLKRCLEP